MVKNPEADKVVRTVSMVAAITASYFLLTADYDCGPQRNVLEPQKGINCSDHVICLGASKRQEDR
ncbi:Adenylosuccinate synthetase [Arachis hypogaea]|nr:Adenylosuccinate synthetase [Arachis hypogaea]